MAKRSKRPTYQIDGESAVRYVPREITSWLDEMRQLANSDNWPESTQPQNPVHKVEWTLVDGTHKERQVNEKLVWIVDGVRHEENAVQNMVNSLLQRRDVTSVLVDGVEQREQ
jgi:hypothetical protein